MCIFEADMLLRQESQKMFMFAVPTGVVAALEEAPEEPSSLLHSLVVLDQEPECNRSREAAGDCAGMPLRLCPYWYMWWWL